MAQEDSKSDDHGCCSSSPVVKHASSSTDTDSAVDGQTFAYSEDRKIGVTGAVFLILNKMIGTGSEYAPRLRIKCVVSHLP